jgi:hypothetical protein
MASTVFGYDLDTFMLIIHICILSFIIFYVVVVSNNKIRDLLVTLAVWVLIEIIVTIN